MNKTKKFTKKRQALFACLCLFATTSDGHESGLSDRTCKERSDGIVSSANVTSFHFPAQHQQVAEQQEKTKKKTSVVCLPLFVCDH